MDKIPVFQTAKWRHKKAPKSEIKSIGKLPRSQSLSYTNPVLTLHPEGPAPPSHPLLCSSPKASTHWSGAER